MSSAGNLAGTARVLVGGGIGALVGAMQWVLVTDGMRRTARTGGLAGIGVAAGWALAVLVASLILLLVAARVLRLRLWALSAIALMAIELAALLVTWQHARSVGLHGDARAVLFLIAMTLEMIGVSLWWPHRERRGAYYGP